MRQAGLETGFSRENMCADRQRGEAENVIGREERVRTFLRTGDSGEPRREQRFVFGNRVREKLFKAGQRFAESVYFFKLRESDPRTEKVFLGRRRRAEKRGRSLAGRNALLSDVETEKTAACARKDGCTERKRKTMAKGAARKAERVRDMRNETARREREICAAGGVAFRRGGGEAYADKGDIPFKNFYGIVL